MLLRPRRFADFARNHSGMAIIEFALMAPLFIGIIAAILEFGVYFVRYEAVQRAVSNAANAIINNPGDNTTQSNDAHAAGLGLVDFNGEGSFFCAQSYVTRAEADNAARAKVCPSTNSWSTGEPNGYTKGNSYYVAVVASVKQESLTTMLDTILPSLTAVSVVTISPQFKPTKCDGPGQYLTYNGTSYSCATLPRCTDGTALFFDGSTVWCKPVTGQAPQGTMSGYCALNSRTGANTSAEKVTWPAKVNTNVDGRGNAGCECYAPYESRQLGAGGNHEYYYSCIMP